jgi:hypothetical protein
MKILLVLVCLVASSSFAASVAESFFGEWKGEDGNIHVITAETWTTILPNGLKKERKITVPSVIEKEDRAGVWVTFNPVETYFCRVFDSKMIRMGPYDYVGSIPSPTDTPNAKKLILHASKIDPAIGRAVVEKMKAKRDADAKNPEIARKRLKGIATSLAENESKIKKAEKELAFQQSRNDQAGKEFAVKAARELEASHSLHDKDIARYREQLKKVADDAGIPQTEVDQMVKEAQKVYAE